jgi:hypothetical protein
MATDAHAGEEITMSEKKETPAEQGAEELGFLRKLMSAFRSEPALGPGPAPVAASPGLTGEQIDARIEASVTARMQTQEVDRDLAALAATVPPAVLQNAETRGLLLAAKQTSGARYKAALDLVAGRDASSLLSGPIAGAEQAGAGRTGLSVNAVDLAWLEQHGVKAEQLAKLEAKYGPLGKPIIHMAPTAN